MGFKPNSHLLKYPQEVDWVTMSGFVVILSKSEVGNQVITKPQGLRLLALTENTRRKDQGERGLKELILFSIHGLY